MGVGYRLFNQIFLGKALNERQVINDYGLIKNKVSEFLYQPIVGNVSGLALRRSKFLKIIEDNYWKRFLPQWVSYYEKKIRSVLMEHREEMALKFKNRIDYVDLSAFGVGLGEEGNNINDDRINKFNYYVDKYSGIGLIYAQVEQLNQKLDMVMLHLVMLSHRYDKRLNMFFG